MNDERRHREDILRRRAERLARTDQSETARKALFQIAVVTVGEEKIGIPVSHLREILRLPPVTPLPGLPAWLLGVTQVRGEIISVLHLGRWLGLSTGPDPSCLAVLGGPRGPLGMLADRTAGFRDIHEDDIAEDVELSRKWPHIHQVTLDLCAILDVPGILADPRLLVGNELTGAKSSIAIEGH